MGLKDFYTQRFKSFFGSFKESSIFTPIYDTMAKKEADTVKAVFTKQTIGMSRELYMSFVRLERVSKVKFTDHMRIALSEYIRKPEISKLLS